MHRIVSIGEVMMRLTPPNKQRLQQAVAFDILYSGSEANVTAALAIWGLSAAHVTSFPDNPLGHAGRMALREKGMDTRYVRMEGGRLGLYFVENGSMQRGTAITYDRLPSAFSQSGRGDYPWLEILEGVSWFHWSGITPALSQSAADALMEALLVCQQKGITVSADINYRNGLWQYGKEPGEVMAPMVALSHVVVASAHDTSRIFEIHPAAGDRPYASIAAQMQQRFPSIHTMISCEREVFSVEHNKLQGICWRQGNVVQSRPYDLPAIVERIGSGDAFMAGFIYGSLHQWEIAACLEFATAAAAHKHSISGDILYCTPKEIHDLAEGQGGGFIKR